MMKCGMRNLQAIMLKMGYVRPGQGIRQGNPVSLPVSSNIGKILCCNQRLMIWESYALLKDWVQITLGVTLSNVTPLNIF